MGPWDAPLSLDTSLCTGTNRPLAKALCSSFSITGRKCGEKHSSRIDSQENSLVTFTLS